jgi:hypothetical protein
MMGVLNDAFARDADNDGPCQGDISDNPALDGCPGSPGSTLGLTSQVAYSQDKFGVKVGFNYGGGGGAAGNICGALLDPITGAGACDTLVNALPNTTRSGILDVVVTVDPIENLSLWVNYDYTYTDVDVANVTSNVFSMNALAFAGRYAVMDTTGISFRFEYLSLGIGDALVVPDEDVGTAQTYTVTLDHELTAGLTAKFEYSHVTVNPDDVQFAGDPNLGDNQIRLQMLYEF